MTASVSKKEAEITAPTQVLSLNKSHTHTFTDTNIGIVIVTDINYCYKAEHMVTLRKLSDKENIALQCEALQSAIETKQSNIAKLQTSALTLQERAQEFTLSATMADSRTAYAVSLYSKISSISWDYSAPTGHLAGCKICSL
jgi:hypothetical protein